MTERVVGFMLHITDFLVVNNDMLYKTRIIHILAYWNQIHVQIIHYHHVRHMHRVVRVHQILLERSFWIVIQIGTTFDDNLMGLDLNDDVLHEVYVHQVEFLCIPQQHLKHVKKVKTDINLQAVKTLVVPILHIHLVHLAQLVHHVNDIN